MNMEHTNRGWKQVQGFTIIEVLVTLVIVAIVAAFAIPSYQSYIEKSRRADAFGCLLETAQRQENYFYQNSTYTTSLANLGIAANTCGNDGYYTLAIAAGPSGNIATSFLLTATRAGVQVSDANCGDLTLNSAGVKGNKNATLAANKCW